MTKVFITGATGQVGAALVEFLIEKQPYQLGTNSPSDILCLVRTPSKAVELKNMGVTIIPGDLDNREAIARALQDPDVKFVFHNAANISTKSNYTEFYRPNVIGTRNVLEAFGKSSAHTFVFASSIAVYDTFLTDKSVFFIDEKTPVGDFTGEFYSITKRKCEAMIRQQIEQHPTKRYLITRLGPIVGKRDPQIIPSFVKLMSMRTVPRLIGNGRDLFVLTSPVDIGRAQTYIAENPAVKSGEVFNIANKPITYREIYDIICDFYRFPRPKFSIPFIMFKLLRPVLPLSMKLFPKNDFFKTAFSPSSLGYIGKSYIYRTKKIESLGFQFTKTPQDTLLECLGHLSKQPEFFIAHLNPYILSFGKHVVRNTLANIKESLELFNLPKLPQMKDKKRRASHLSWFLFVLLLLALIMTYMYYEP